MPFDVVSSVATAAKDYAPLISAGVGLAGAFGGAASSSGAISDGQKAALATSQQASTGAQNLYAPYMGSGANALAAYGNLTGINGPDAAAASMANFTASPGYQYQLSEGLRGVDQAAAAKGVLRSGATLKAEQTLGSNLANQDFGNYLGRLNQLSQFGIQGTSGAANALLGQANQQQSTITSGAGAQASIDANLAKGVIGVANQWASNSTGAPGDKSLSAYDNGGASKASTFNDPNTTQVQDYQTYAPDTSWNPA